MKKTITTVLFAATMFGLGVAATDIYHDIQKQEHRAERITSEACNALSDQDGTPWDECMRMAGFVIPFN